jgi:hypothetical protein
MEAPFERDQGPERAVASNTEGCVHHRFKLNESDQFYARILDKQLDPCTAANQSSLWLPVMHLRPYFSTIITFFHVEFWTVIRLRPGRIGFYFLQKKLVFLDPCAALCSTCIMPLSDWNSVLVSNDKWSWRLSLSLGTEVIMRRAILSFSILIH